MNILCLYCNQAFLSDDPWHGLHKRCFTKQFNLSDLQDFEAVTFRHQSFDAACPPNVPESTFYHGAFRKYSGSLGNKKYLLKVQEERYPELPATEYVCNQIFTSLGIQVPPSALVLFKNSLPCFVTENFLPMKGAFTLAHLYHFFKKDEQYSCENVLRIIGEKTNQISAQENVVMLTLADSLIGNNDRHGRNIAFMHSSNGYRLAPFYDNASSLGTELVALLEADLQPKGAIATAATREPSMKDYVHEWERLGYASTIDQFKAAISLSTIENIIAKSTMGPKRKEALFNLIRKRYREI